MFRFALCMLVAVATLFAGFADFATINTADAGGFFGTTNVRVNPPGLFNATNVRVNNGGFFGAANVNVNTGRGFFRANNVNVNVNSGVNAVRFTPSFVNVNTFTPTVAVRTSAVPFFGGTNVTVNSFGTRANVFGTRTVVDATGNVFEVDSYGNAAFRGNSFSRGFTGSSFTTFAVPSFGGFSAFSTGCH